jgi:anti-anti-sigma factor
MNDKCVEIYETGRYLYIKPLQSITDDIIDDFKNAITRQCNDTDNHIILDLQHVLLLSSRAITDLIRLYKLQQNKDKKIALVCLTKEMEYMIDSINLSKLIPMYKTIDDFLLSLGEKNQDDREEVLTKVRIEEQYNISIVNFESDFEEINSSNVDFKGIFSRIEKNNVIINLINILNMNEDSITSFITFADKLSEKNGKLVLVGVNETTKELFNLLAIENEFLFADSTEEGIKIICF